MELSALLAGGNRRWHRLRHARICCAKTGGSRPRHAAYAMVVMKRRRNILSRLRVCRASVAPVATPRARSFERYLARAQHRRRRARALRRKIGQASWRLA